MLILGRADVRELLDVDVLIDALAQAMADVSASEASMPPRIAAFVPERDAMLAAMPAYVPSIGALTAKLVSLFPQNAGTELPTHQAAIVAFDPRTGSPIALLDGTEITATRTAAGCALSARLLAREDAAVLAILGTGVQARSHARALPRVRAIRAIRVAGRDPAKAQALARELRGELEIDVEAAESFEDAARGADVVCAATHAAEPVVRLAWLRPGTHVTSVGYNPAGREIDEAAIAGAQVFVESRAAALAPPPSGSNDLAGVDPQRCTEIGELVLGHRPGRTSPEAITLYKSVGVAAQDAAAAALVLAAARERGIGREVAL